MCLGDGKHFSESNRRNLSCDNQEEETFQLRKARTRFLRMSLVFIEQGTTEAVVEGIEGKSIIGEELESWLRPDNTS